MRNRTRYLQHPSYNAKRQNAKRWAQHVGFVILLDVVGISHTHSQQQSALQTNLDTA